MRDERFVLMDNAQLNLENITGFPRRSIFNISWSYTHFDNVKFTGVRQRVR
jgi:hypothetical protein